MRRGLKLGGAALGIVGVLLLAGAGTIYAVSEGRLARTWDVEPAALTLPTDSASLAWGRHLALTRGCTDCHAEDLGGGLFADEPPVFRIYASNLTRGEGGLDEWYGPRDWVRAIRHGIGSDGRALLFMPSQEFNALSDADLAALVAYLESLPPVDRTPVENAVYPVGRLLYLRGALPLVPAELIDHGRRDFSAPPYGATAEYGRYLAVGCTGCHGADFRGGPIPGTPPDWPPATDVSSAGLADWSEADFFRALREGLRPDGSVIDPVMPVRTTSRLDDQEIRALWLFLSGRGADEADVTAGHSPSSTPF